MEGGLSAIDWGAPWFAPWADVGRQVGAHGHPALHDALNAGASHGRSAAQDAAHTRPGQHLWPRPPRFVPQSELPAGVPYEQFIFAHGCVPVREGLHDFFNGLCWLQFPRTKAAFNRLQAQAIARDGIAARRGPVRDAITVFDENGALLAAPQPIWEALLARRWRALFVDLRPLWREARLLVFGHALLEQLVQPRKNLTAHVWRADAATAAAAALVDGRSSASRWCEAMDAWLAAQCSAGMLATKPFTPLPVLGIPGWCAANENFSFYDDSLVFRPRRTPEPTITTTTAGPSRP